MNKYERKIAEMMEKRAIKKGRICPVCRKPETYGTHAYCTGDEYLGIKAK